MWLPVKQADLEYFRLSSDNASPKRVELLSVKDVSFDASLNASASGIGVIEFRLSMMHQFLYFVSYKFKSQKCVSSFMGFMLVFGTCAAEFV